MLIDANLLIYAVNRDLPQHAAARSWLEDTFSQSEPVGLPWVVILAFLRLCTVPHRKGSHGKSLVLHIGSREDVYDECEAANHRRD